MSTLVHVGHFTVSDGAGRGGKEGREWTGVGYNGGPEVRGQQGATVHPLLPTPCVLEGSPVHTRLLQAVRQNAFVQQFA